MNEITNETLLTKHGSPCPYCLRTMNVHSKILRPTRDHVKPRSRFRHGKVLIVCAECNRLKGDRTLVEYVMFLTWKNEELERQLVLDKLRLKNLSYLVSAGLD